MPPIEHPLIPAFEPFWSPEKDGSRQLETHLRAQHDRAQQYIDVAQMPSVFKVDELHQSTLPSEAQDRYAKYNWSENPIVKNLDTYLGQLGLELKHDAARIPSAFGPAARQAHAETLRRHVSNLIGLWNDVNRQLKTTTEADMFNSVAVRDLRLRYMSLEKNAIADALRDLQPELAQVVKDGSFEPHPNNFLHTIDSSLGIAPAKILHQQLAKIAKEPAEDVLRVALVRPGNLGPDGTPNSDLNMVKAEVRGDVVQKRNNKNDNWNKYVFPALGITGGTLLVALVYYAWRQSRQTVAEIPPSAKNPKNSHKNPSGFNSAMSYGINPTIGGYGDGSSAYTNQNAYTNQTNGNGQYA